MHPVDCLVEVKRVPSQLVGDKMDFLPWLVLRICVEGAGFTGFEVAVTAGGKDSIQP
jgi:hypothetical protein